MHAQRLARITQLTALLAVLAAIAAWLLLEEPAAALGGVLLALAAIVVIFVEALRRNLRVPPLERLKAQLDMHARADPDEAFRHCHRVVHELLKQAENYHAHAPSVEK